MPRVTVPEPRALCSEYDSVPLSTLRPPEKLLLPPRVRVPVPSLVRAPRPAILDSTSLLAAVPSTRKAPVSILMALPDTPFRSPSASLSTTSRVEVALDRVSPAVSRIAWPPDRIRVPSDTSVSPA